MSSFHAFTTMKWSTLICFWLLVSELKMPFSRKCCNSSSQLHDDKKVSVFKLPNDVQQYVIQEFVITRRPAYICGICLSQAASVVKNELDGVGSQTEFSCSTVSTQTNRDLVSVASQTDFHVVDISSKSSRINAINEIIEKDFDEIKNDMYGVSMDKHSNDIETLSSIDPWAMYAKHNSTITCFIDKVTGTAKNIFSKKIALKKLLIVDLLISVIYPYYVSSICLASSVLNYCVSGSKASCEVFSHCLPSGSYSYLRDWMKYLSKRDPSPAPNGILAYAFDNNQRLQRVWLSRNGNKQTLEIMTNVLRIKLQDTDDQYKEELDPKVWRHFKFLDEHFELTYDEFKRISILKEAFITFMKKSNDDSIENSITIEEKEKNTIKCEKCQVLWPKRKIKCDNCGLNIRSQSKESEIKFTKIDKIEKQQKGQASLKFHEIVPVEQKDGSIFLEKKKLKLEMETLKSEDIVHSVPPMSLIDPVFVNPSSKSALRHVLDKIGEDAGIISYGQGKRFWVFVVCDGSPMTLIWRLLLEEPEKYSWVVPITGLGHEEMNMVRAFSDLYYEMILKEFYISQGYISPKALAFARACSDHHIAYNNMMKFREAIWLELIFTARQSIGDIFNFENFLSFVDNSKDKTLGFLVTSLLPMLESIFIFRKGVRNNDTALIENARFLFRPIWYGRNHPKYLRIDFFDQCSRSIMPPEILSILKNNESVTSSGRGDAHQGLDFILEEFNRNVKNQISGAADSEKWSTVIRNYDSLCDLRRNISSILSTNFDEKWPRQIVDYETERDHFRKIHVIRKSGYLKPVFGRGIEGLGPSFEPSTQIDRFISLSNNAIVTFLESFRSNYSYPDRVKITKIPCSKFEENESLKDENKTNSQLQALIIENIQHLPEERKEEFMDKKNSFKIHLAKKSILIEFLNEIRGELISK